MKKVISLFVFILCLSTIYSQTSTTPPAFVMTAKDSALAKAWKVKMYERFGIESTPAGKEANDGITLMLDQTAFVTLDGEAKTGTWVTDKAKTTITFTSDTKEVMKFRITKYESEQIVMKYQDKELITTVYILVPKK